MTRDSKIEAAHERRQQLLLDSEEEFRTFKSVAKEFELAEFVESLGKDIGYHLECELAHRRSERAKALKIAQVYEDEAKREEHYHKLNLAGIDKALQHLRSGRKRIPEQKLQRMDQLFKDTDRYKEFREISQDAASEILLELEIEPEITLEISEILEDIQDNVVHNKGANGILDHMDEKLSELRKIRSEERSKGRDMHYSPLIHPKVLWIIIMACGYLFALGWCQVTQPDPERCKAEANLVFLGATIYGVVYVGC